MLSKHYLKNDWILTPSLIEKLLQQLDFRDGAIDYICQAAREVSQSDNADALLDFCQNWSSKTKQEILANFSCEWMALAAVYGFPKTIEQHQKRGVPFEITKSTFWDMQRRMDDYFAKNGR